MAGCLSFSEYYRCLSEHVLVETLNGQGGQAASWGWFAVGKVPVCWGCLKGAQAAESASGRAHDALARLSVVDGRLLLPFDLDRTVEGLRLERYLAGLRGNEPHGMTKTALRACYYHLRPHLPVSLRRHLQRVYLAVQRGRGFPRWPVDATVDDVMAEVLRLVLAEVGELPFVWFWPRGYRSCLLMTHDVESQAGLAACDMLMDLDAAHGIRSSFQLVPRERYRFTAEDVRRMRERGFEVNLHGLTHDGRLFDDHAEFLRRVAKINAIARAHGIRGFRSPVLYRNPKWMAALDFDYDMSFPCVARLDPQPGGCCTVMPFFLGAMVELPVTMTQDYTLFHLLGSHSTELWERQLHEVTARSGLASFIVHPDYLEHPRERDTYTRLLELLAARDDLWNPLPGEAAAWWRGRSRMRLARVDGQLVVEGEGSEEAVVAVARLDGGRVVVEVGGEMRPLP